MQDNIAVDGDFDQMGGFYLAHPLDDNMPGEVKLFQAIVLQELLKKEETPQQFIGWLHTSHAKTYCSLANLDVKFLEMAARRLEKEWPKLPRKRLVEALNGFLGGAMAEMG